MTVKFVVYFEVIQGLSVHIQQSLKPSLTVKFTPKSMMTTSCMQNPNAAIPIMANLPF